MYGLHAEHDDLGLNTFFFATSVNLILNIEVREKHAWYKKMEIWNCIQKLFKASFICIILNIFQLAFLEKNDFQN